MCSTHRKSSENKNLKLFSIISTRISPVRILLIDKLDKDEMLAMFHKYNIQMNEEQLDKFFMKIDEDKDCILS